MGGNFSSKRINVPAYTRVLLNSFTFHDKGSFDLWRSFELGNAIICKILFVFTTSEITAPILNSLPPCRSSEISKITFLGAFNRKCVWSIKQIWDGFYLQFNSQKESCLSAAQVCYFKTIWLIYVVVHVFQPKSGISSIDMMSAAVVIGTAPWYPPAPDWEA